jgi:DNA-binding transcriptional ArsR family regulator
MNQKQNDLKFDNELFRQGEQTYRALNNSLRQRIIALLHKNGKMSVMEIYRKMKIEQSVASSQLAILRKEGYLIAKKVERFVYYSVNYKRMKEVGEKTKELVGED